MSLIYQHLIDKKSFTFISDAYNGTGGFSDGSYLNRYSRESDEKLDRRKAVAWYQNDIKPASERFTAYLFKKPPTRELNHPLVEAFADDCDWRGNSLDIFLANFASESKARGSGLLLIDMPKVPSTNAAQQAQDRFYPYLISIPLEKVHSFQTNERGLFTEIGIDSTYLVDGFETPCIRWWNTTSWWITNGVDIIDGGDHNLGICPILSFSEGIGWPYLGAFSQIAYLSKRLYNMRSELDEILRSQTFSLLTYQIPQDAQGTVNPTQIAETISTSNMLTYPGATPSFVAPPEGPATVYLEAISALEQTIREVSLDASSSVNSKSNETGIALTIRFQTLNGSLVSFARRMEDLERRIFSIISLWLNIKNTVKVSWAKDFNISDITVELNTLTAMKANTFPQEVINEKMKQIIKLDFSNVEAKDMTTLLESVDKAPTPVVEPPILTVDLPNDPNAGLNTNPIGV